MSHWESDIFIPADGDTVDKIDEIINWLDRPVPFAGLPHTDQLTLLSTMLKDDAFDGYEMLYNHSFEINALLADMVIEKITAEEFKKILIDGLTKENKPMFTQLIEERFRRINQEYIGKDDAELPAVNDSAYSDIRETINEINKMW